MEINEIIKALRHCSVNGSSCRECPIYEQDSGYPDRLHAQAADMLEAQQKRITELEEPEKPLSAFLAPMDCYKGLKRKFLVFKSDTGEMIENCFVLRPDKDTAAVVALRAYAEETDNDTLAADIINWVGAECNDPLTLDELREMDGEPVWLLPDRRCYIVNNDLLLPWGEREPCGVDMWGAGTSLSLLAKCGVYRFLPREDM